MGTKVKFSTAYHPQTDGQLKEQFKYLRICLEPMLWIGEVNEIKIFLLLSSLTIIVTIRAFRWLLMKHCMSESTERLYVRWKLVIESC